MKASSEPKTVKGRGSGVYVFDDEDRVLLTQPGPKARHEQYKWEGPGGACDPGESHEDAAKRELVEELGVKVELTAELARYEAVVDSNGDVWEAVIFKGTITDIPVIQEPEKCVGFGWFTRDEVKCLSLADYAVKDFQRMGWL